jgi:hypothetical protein
MQDRLIIQWIEPGIRGERRASLLRLYDGNADHQ